MYCTKKIVPFEGNPCLNSGACENIPSSGKLPPTFKCTCVGDFTGQRCYFTFVHTISHFQLSLSYMVQVLGIFRAQVEGMIVQLIINVIETGNCSCSSGSH